MKLTQEDIREFQHSNRWTVSEAFRVAEVPSRATDSELRIAFYVLSALALGLEARRAAWALAGEYAARA